MTIDTTRIIGLIAGLMTASSLLPQVVRTIKTKSAGDISILMLLFFVVGIVFWLIYGFMLGELPIIVANAITLVLATILIICKLKFG